MVLLAVASPALAQSDSRVQPAPLLPGETLLQVAAHGSVRATPDVASLTTTVISDGVDAETARSRNAQIADRLIAAVRTIGISDDAMRTEALRVGPRFRPARTGTIAT